MCGPRQYMGRVLGRWAGFHGHRVQLRFSASPRDCRRSGRLAPNSDGPKFTLGVHSSGDLRGGICRPDRTGSVFLPLRHHHAR